MLITTQSVSIYTNATTPPENSSLIVKFEAFGDVVNAPGFFKHEQFVIITKIGQEFAIDKDSVIAWCLIPDFNTMH